MEFYSVLVQYVVSMCAWGSRLFLFCFCFKVLFEGVYVQLLTLYVCSSCLDNWVTFEHPCKCCGELGHLASDCLNDPHDKAGMKCMCACVHTRACVCACAWLCVCACAWLCNSA